jgi:hypothetical protein
MEPETEPGKPEETPETELTRKPKKPSKPKKPPTAPSPKPPKAPAKPRAREFQPIDLGPGFEEPTPSEEPNIQSPIKSVQSGMATPKHIKIRKPHPDKPEVIDRELDDPRLP